MRTAFGLLLRILFTLALISLSVPAYSANVSWMNPSGGNWNNGTNWSTGTVPGADDIVYINYTGDYAVVLDMNPTIKGLVLGNIFGDQQKLICTSWELTVNGSVTIEEYGYLDLNTSAVHTSGDYILTNKGTLDIYNSSIELKIQNTGDMLLQKTCSFDRSFLNDTTGTMTLEGTSETSCQLTVDTNFTNRGVIDLTSSWPVTATTATLVLNKGWLVNEPTGEINALLGSSFNNTSTRWLYAAITNQGTITAAGTGLGIYKVNAVHTNSGTYYAQGGTISFSQSGSGSTFDHTGTIQTDTGVGFYFNSDTFTWPSGTITNNGILGFLGTDITFTPKYTNPGRIELNGSGTVLNLTDTLFNDGTLYMTNGTVDGSVPIINNDSIVCQIGTINVDVHNNGVMRATNSANINGTLTTTASSKIIPEAQTLNDVFFTVDQGFVNHGEILLTQAAQHNSYIVVPLNTDTLYNASDGIITSAAGEGATAGVRYVAATLYNEGTVNVEDALLRVSLTNAPHTNAGTMNVTGQDLQFTGNFTNQGTVNVATDKYVTFSGKTFVLGNGNLVGPGHVSFTSDTLYINGACTSSVDLMIAPIKADISGTLLNNGIADILGLTVVGSGTITNTNDLTIQSCTIAPDLDNQGTLTALKTTSVTGTFSNGTNDTLTILAQSGGSSNMTVANSFTNYGDIVLTSDVADDTHLSTLSLTAGSITNSATGTITADLGSSTGGSRRLYAALNNQGTIQNKNINLIIEKSGANHLNSGTVEVLSGQLDLNLTGVGSFTNNGTIHFSNLQTLIVDQGTFNNNTTGTITGNGSLNLYATTFANDGWVEPGDSPGTISMQANNFVMDANAQIRIELGGTTAITEYDRVYCTQNANLGGVMNIEFIDDYIPAVNDSFLVLNYSTRIGDFLGILGLNQMGVELDTNFTATGLYLVARTVTNLAPVITGMPDSVSFSGDTSTLLGIWNYVSDDHTSDSNHVYDFTVDNDSLNYELNAAGFLILTADTGFSGTVTLGMTVTDQHGASSSDTTIVTVTDPNTAPVIAGMSPVTAMDADDSFNLGVWSWVTDAESHDSLLDYHFTSSNDSLVFAYDTALGFVSISSISGYNDSAWLVLLVTDPGGKTATDSTLYVITYNFAPAFSGLADSVTFRTDSTLTVDIHAVVSDAEEADADLVYTFASGNDSLEYAWVSLSGTLDLFTSNDWSGNSTVIATVTDSGGKQAVDTIVVTVTPIPNTAPTLTALADSLTFQTDANLIVDIWAAAADAESHDSLLTYGFTDNNDSLDQAWSDTTGQLTLTATNGYTGTAELYVTVTDPEALSVTDTVIVVVTDIPNTPPVLAAIPDTSLACDQALVVGLWGYVTDAETTDSLLVYTFGYESDSTVGVFDTTTGELSLAVVGGYSGTSDVYVTVTDPLAASDVDTFEVTFANIAPTVNLPDSVSFDADTSYALDYFSLVTDNDPDSMLYFAFSASNDSLERSYDTDNGVLTLSATSGFSGQVFLYLTVTDPDSALAHDTCVVWVMPALGVGDEDDSSLPDDYMLAQNYPNPFNPSTAIEYALPEQSYVTLVVFNVLGQEMQVLVDEVQSAGTHIAFWDGIDYHGQSAASGVYFYRIQAGPFNLTRKMVLIK